ncbi:MAG TPA: hypothetical protein VJ875_24685 [Pyrinomonadaceae bacterium]|nr:hypothetical protein [Pyrinomonadaceae bacterium]
MKRFVLAIALLGLMSVTALAGEIPTNGAPAPAPTTTSSTASTSSTVLVTVILTVLGLR